MVMWNACAARPMVHGPAPAPSPSSMTSSSAGQRMALAVKKFLWGLRCLTTSPSCTSCMMTSRVLRQQQAGGRVRPGRGAAQSQARLMLTRCACIWDGKALKARAEGYVILKGRRRAITDACGPAERSSAPGQAPAAGPYWAQRKHSTMEWIPAWPACIMPQPLTPSLTCAARSRPRPQPAHSPRPASTPARARARPGWPGAARSACRSTCRTCGVQTHSTTHIQERALRIPARAAIAVGLLRIMEGTHRREKLHRHTASHWP